MSSWNNLLRRAFQPPPLETFRPAIRTELLSIYGSFTSQAALPALPGLAPEWYKWSFSWGRISLGGRPQVLAEPVVYTIVSSTSGAHS